MASLNIPSTCADPNYRYTMPPIVTKVEGKGKMIKTLILNMDAVAAALDRPPSYIIRFFGTELGAQCKDDMVISGTHSAETLQSLLDKFIEKYVLCRDCRNPEVKLRVQKGSVCGKCAACGWRGPMENSDRLAEFILKHPPDDVNDDKDKAKKPDKRDRQLAKAAAAREAAQKGLVRAKVDEANEVATTAGAEGSLEAEKMRDELDENNDAAATARPKMSLEAEKKREKKERKEKKGKKEKEKKERDKRAQDNAHGTNGDEIIHNNEICDVIASITAFVCRDGSGVSPNLSGGEFLEEIRNHQLAKAFDHRVRLHVALESLLGDALSAERLRKLRHLWGALIKDASMKASDILDTFGMYLLRHPSEASVSKLSPVLKLLYDGDWVDECGALEYYENQAQNPLREASVDAAQPFLRWLRQSSSASESEEEDTDT